MVVAVADSHVSPLPHLTGGHVRRRGIRGIFYTERVGYLDHSCCNGDPTLRGEPALRKHRARSRFVSFSRVFLCTSAAACKPYRVAKENKKCSRLSERGRR